MGGAVELVRIDLVLVDGRLAVHFAILELINRDVHVIGPSRMKALTHALGLAVLDLLRHAGAELTPGGDDHTFVRTRPGEKGRL